jgi:hypothetical protein
VPVQLLVHPQAGAVEDLRVESTAVVHGVAA